MREVKFRCYNKYLGRWLVKQEIYDELSDQALYNPEKGDDVVLMQYTGLKDKNGKEIYEGDILDKTHYCNGQIKDRIGSVKMGYVYDSDGYSNSEIYCCVAGDSALSDVAQHCNVIGNIYENPELLSNN